MFDCYLVMGVSGVGKSTIGAALAEALDARFLEGDNFHSEKNIAHMRAGKPLDDDMRWPWLTALGVAARDSAAEQVTVVACSALKRSYRDHLRGFVDFKLICPDAPLAEVKTRIEARQGHYMPASLLESQFAIFDRPKSDESPTFVRPFVSLPEILSQIT